MSGTSFQFASEFFHPHRLASHPNMHISLICKLDERTERHRSFFWCALLKSVSQSAIQEYVSCHNLAPKPSADVLFNRSAHSAWPRSHSESFGIARDARRFVGTSCRDVGENFGGAILNDLGGQILCA